MVDGSFRPGHRYCEGAGVRSTSGPGDAAGSMGSLAAYGSDGVDNVMKMLQSETARTMGNCSKVNVARARSQSVEARPVLIQFL